MATVSDVNGLVVWLSRQGFCLPPHLNLVYLDDVQGYGVLSRKRLEAGETLFSLPSSLLITPNTLQRRLASLQHNHKLSKWHPNAFQSLVVWLLIERCSIDSQWTPYIRLLPRSFNTPPFYPAYIVNCFPPHLICGVRERRRRVRLDYQTLRPHLVEIQRAAALSDDFSSYQLFRWAWCCVNTRCVSMPALQAALAPFLDFLNHTSHSQVVRGGGFDEKSQCYEVINASRVEANEQVFISYGPHSNRTLALEYGFILSSNTQHPSVQFNLDDLLCCARSPLAEEAVVQELMSRRLHLDLSLTVDGPSWCLLEAITLLVGPQDIDRILNQLINNRIQQLVSPQHVRRVSSRSSHVLSMISVLIQEELDILTANKITSI